MSNLITFEQKEFVAVNNEDGRLTVLGRVLHEALEVKDKYTQWFSRMCEYGFAEDIDFSQFREKVPEVGRPLTIS